MRKKHAPFKGKFKSFDPTSEQIAKSTNQFVKNGGRIHKVEFCERDDVEIKYGKINPDLCDSGHITRRNYPIGYFG